MNKYLIIFNLHLPIFISFFIIYHNFFNFLILGNKILLWVEKSHTAEIVATQLGSALSGVVVVPSVA